MAQVASAVTPAQPDTITWWRMDLQVALHGQLHVIGPAPVPCLMGWVRAMSFRGPAVGRRVGREVSAAEFQAVCCVPRLIWGQVCQQTPMCNAVPTGQVHQRMREFRSVACVLAGPLAIRQRELHAQVPAQTSKPHSAATSGTCAWQL